MSLKYRAQVPPGVGALSMSVNLVPITDDDAHRVAWFLHEHLNEKVALQDWMSAVAPPWPVDKPNAGYMLLDGDAVVGVYLAFYSQRRIDGRDERFCNLGAWCVLPRYRLHSVRLVKALLAQDGYHFTDLSPMEHVARLNMRLGFRLLSAPVLLVPNLPLGRWPRDHVISSDPAVIRETLDGDDLRLYRDHLGAAAVTHVVLRHGDERCYVALRRERRKRLPLFMTVLHVTNPELLRALAAPFAWHLLARHGVVAQLAEERVIGRRPRLAFRLGRPNRKMFRSDRLRPDQVDYLYSELACVRW